MRKLILIILLFCSQFGFAQTESVVRNFEKLLSSEDSACKLLSKFIYGNNKLKRKLLNNSDYKIIQPCSTRSFTFEKNNLKSIQSKELNAFLETYSTIKFDSIVSEIKNTPFKVNPKLNLDTVLKKNCISIIPYNKIIGNNCFLILEYNSREKYSLFRKYDVLRYVLCWCIIDAENKLLTYKFYSTTLSNNNFSYD